MDRQYVGARYVPYFYQGQQGNVWQAGVAYEALTVVTYLNTSYTSTKPVPPATGNPADNPTYWVATGNYNAQVEQYRIEVENAIATIINKPFKFSNKSDMQAYTGFKSGNIVELSGYYTANDNGGGQYIVSTTAGNPNIPISGGLYANLIFNPKKINVCQFGVTPENTTNAAILQTLFNTYGQAEFFFPAGTYEFEKPVIIVTGYSKVVGENNTIFKSVGAPQAYSYTFNGKTYSYTVSVPFIVGGYNNASSNTYIHNVVFENITIASTKSNVGLIAIGTAYLKLINCYIHTLMQGAEICASFGTQINDCVINDISQRGIYCKDCTTVFINNSSLDSLGAYASLEASNSTVNVQNTICNQSYIASHDESNVRFTNCTFECNNGFCKCRVNSFVTAVNCFIENHFDSLYSSAEFMNAENGSTVRISDCNLLWTNYSGQPNPTRYNFYTANNNSTIYVYATTASGFIKYTGYNSNAGEISIWLNYAEMTQKNYMPTAGAKFHLNGASARLEGHVLIINADMTATEAINDNDVVLVLPANITPREDNILFGFTAGTDVYHSFVSVGQNIQIMKGINSQTRIRVHAAIMANLVI